MRRTRTRDKDRRNRTRFNGKNTCYKGDMAMMTMWQFDHRVLVRTTEQDLPLELCALSRLHVLALEGNLFASLPAFVFRLPRLVRLGFDEQRCSMRVEEPLDIPVLNILRGRGCNAEFPELRTETSSCLSHLFWGHNGISTLPSLTQFSASLRMLDVAHNNLHHVDEIFCLEHLRDLSLAGNFIASVPSGIVKLRCLQQLWLHGNLLQALPEEFGELENLAILELHHNKLKTLPASFIRLRKLNWLFLHGNELVEGLSMLAQLPRLKICGLGANRLDLSGVNLRELPGSFGLGWNPGINEDVFSESLTTTDFLLDPLQAGEVQETLVVTFSSQGAPVAQGQAEVRALRDQLLKVDALYVCDPANAWFLQDAECTWSGLTYFDQKMQDVTSRYRGDVPDVWCTCLTGSFPHPHMLSTCGSLVAMWFCCLAVLSTGKGCWNTFPGHVHGSLDLC